MFQARRSLLALGSVALACVGISCGGASAARDDEGKQVAATFLDEIRAGRIEPAWQTTSVEFKSLMGSSSLRDYARTHPALKGQAEFVESQPVSSSGGRLVEYQFRATPPPLKGGSKKSAASKTPPTPKTIRVMVSFNEAPPKVERVATE